MIQVTELGYIGIGVKDVDAWKNFASKIVGFEVADDGERDRCYLRMDYFHHRIVMHQDPSDDLQYLGFRVAGAEEFGAMQLQLSEAGLKFRVGSDDEANERHVLEVLKLQDPGGNPVEIFHGPEVQFQKPFYPGRPMHGKFKTGKGGLGHCIIRQADPTAAQKFYHALGMRGGVEYKIKIGNGFLQIRFMHCNERDHTVAFGVPDGSRMLNHIMLEVDNFDDVGMTHELVRSQKVPVAMGIGKHSNDHMYSFYFNTPSGWMIEYGCGARESTYQSEYYTRDIYGHHAEQGGFGMPK